MGGRGGLNVAMGQRRKDGDGDQDGGRFARRRRGGWWWLKVNVVEMDLGGNMGQNEPIEPMQFAWAGRGNLSGASCRGPTFNGGAPPNCDHCSGHQRQLEDCLEDQSAGNHWWEIQKHCGFGWKSRLQSVFVA